MRLRQVRYALLLMSVIAAVAGCTSHAVGPSPSVSSTAKPDTTTGTEVFTGDTVGEPMTVTAPVISVGWSGPVNATGSFTLGSRGPKRGDRRTFVTSAGDLVIRVTRVPDNGNHLQLLFRRTCEVGSTTVMDFRVLGAKSTGKFRGAADSNGRDVVVFEANVPRLKSGKCDVSDRVAHSIPSPFINLTASVTLTVKN